MQFLAQTTSRGSQGTVEATRSMLCRETDWNGCLHYRAEAAMCYRSLESWENGGRGVVWKTKLVGGNMGQGGLGPGLERIVRLVSGAGAAVQGQG